MDCIECVHLLGLIGYFSDRYICGELLGCVNYNYPFASHREIKATAQCPNQNWSIS